MAATILLSELVSAARPESTQRISVSAKVAPSSPPIATPLLRFEAHPVSVEQMRDTRASYFLVDPDQLALKCQSSPELNARSMQTRSCQSRTRGKRCRPSRRTTGTG